MNIVSIPNRKNFNQIVGALLSANAIPSDKKKLYAFKNTVIAALLVLISSAGWGQNSFNSGDGWGAGWGTGASMSASAGTSLIYTTTNSSGGAPTNRFFRFFGTGSPCGEYQPNNGGNDLQLNVNQTYTSTNIQCGGAKAFFVSVSNTTDNWVFKSASSTAQQIVVFRVQGAVRTISSVAQAPVAASVFPGQGVLVTASMSGAQTTGQNVYIRYTTDNFATSTVAAMTYSASSATFTIPASVNTPSASIKYYIFTSGTANVAADGSNADFYTINLNNNGGSNYSYTVASGWTTTASGAWTNAGTWTANAVPPTTTSMGPVTINHNVTSFTADAVCSSISIGAAGTLTASSNTLTINNGTTGTTFTKNATGTYTASGTHTVVFSGAATHTVSGTVTFQNVTTSTGLNFGSASTISATGIFQISAGGFVSTNPPTYTAGSTLAYNSGTNYGVSTEWTAGATSGAGYPSNVSISNNIPSSGLNFGASNIAYSMRGTMNLASATSTLALSTGSGGLNIGGDWTRNASATFTTNSKTVTFNGTAAQTINNATTFFGLTIANTAATVTGAANITMATSGVLTINSSARLDIAATTLTLTGATSSISGFLRSAGTITGASTATLTIANGGTYEHNFTTSNGTIPTATWNTGSTCAIIGYTTNTTVPAGATQTFSNFTWNTPNQNTGSINFAGSTPTINGIFTVAATGTTSARELRLSGNTAYTLTGNTSTGIGGLVVSGGVLNLSSGSSTSVINLIGDFNQSGGQIIWGGSGSATINLVKSSGPQTLTQSSGTISNNISWNAGNGTSTNTVQLLSNINLGTGTGTFTVANGSSMDFQTFVLSGSGSFVPATGSTLISANLSGTGAFQTSTANGSVQTTTRTFTATGVSYTFNGASAQFTGNAIGAASNIRNLTFNTTGSLTLSSSATLSATGVLAFGTNATTFILGANDLTLTSGATISGAGSTKYVRTSSTGQLKRTALTTAFTFPVGNSAYNPITLTNTGASDTYGIIASDGTVPNALDATKAVNRYWAVTEGTGGGGNLAVTAQFNTADGAGVNYSTAANQFIGLYPNASPWTQNGSGAAASGSNPFTVTASGFTNTLPTSGSTYYFAVGTSGAFVAPPVAPTITSFSVASPGSGSSGYVGNTITVTGTGFLASGMTVKIGGSSGTTVSYSFTNSTTITITAINLGGTIYIDNGTAPAATSSASYTNLGYITTTTGPWNTTGTWLGGAVPVANSNVTIAHAVSIAAAFTNTPIASITVNTGITATASHTGAIGTVTNAITTNGTGVFTFSGAGGSIIAGSVVNAGTLSWSAAATLNISASGTLTNNGTFTRGTGTVTIANAATINGSGAITFNNLTITAGTATLTTVPAIDGTLTITSGGVSAAPVYTTNSTLNYNGVSVRSTEWNATGVGTIGTTAGYPNNVTISTGTVDIVNGSNTARALNGTLTVNTGATFNLNGLNAALTIGGGLTTVGTGTFSMGSTNAAVTVAGAVSNAGTLTLSSTSGGNLNVAGNWSNSGTFTPNSRTVTFNGTAAGQTINNATTFFAVVIDNTNAAGVLVATSNNLTVTNSLVVNASRLLDVNAGIVHSGSTFTVNGTLRISAGGFVQNASPAPVYGAASALIYNASTYGRSNEWNATGAGTIGTTAGYPNNVTINTGTFDIVNGSSTARAINGTLTVNTGATFNVNALNAALTIGSGLTTVGTGTFSMGSTNAGVTVAGTLTNAGTVTLSTATASLTVSGAVSNSGALTLSSNIGGDIYVTGNFTNNGTFTHSNRALFLNGTTQTLGGSNINGSGTTNCFPFLILQNGTNVTLAASAAVTNTLTLTSGKITLSTFDLNMGASAIASANSTNYIVTNSTGQLKRTVTTSAVTFPVGNSAYNPITFTNAGTSDTYGIRVANGAPANANDATYTIQRSWYITEATAGGSDLTPVVSHYNTGEEGANFNAGITSYMGLYNATSWTQVATTLAGSNPYTATSTGTAQFPATIPAGSYMAIGKDVGLTTTPPTITSFTSTSGYSGSSTVITGTNFLGATAVSFGGTAAASFTVNSATQITAVVGTGGSSGSVSITTPSGSTSLAGFTYLGFITTTGATTWNTGASWLGGAVPTANNAVTVNHNLSINAAFTNSPVTSITVNTGITATASHTGAIGTITNAITTVGTGTFTFSGAGSIIVGSVVNGGTLSWSAAATLNINAGGTLTNNGTFTRGTGTVNFVGSAGTVNGSNAITFNNLTNNSGALTLTTIPTIDGTLQLNGGFVSAAPIYTSNSTLYYNLSYNRSTEWSATGVGTIGTTAGYPNNVTINTGTFDIVNGSNTARAMNGTLTVNTGATFNVNVLNAAVTIGGGLTTVGTGTFNMGTTNAAVTVAGAVTNAGSLTLSSTLGGDIFVAGNFTNNGTFTHNTRAVFLNGTTQTVSGSALNTSGTTNCFDFLFIQNNSQVTLGAAVTVRSNLTFTSGDIILSTFNLTLSSGSTITGASSANYVITNSTGLLVRTLATSTAVTFPIGNSAYNPITLSQSGASDVYSLRMINGSISGLTPNDVTRTINRRWSFSRTSSTIVNITVSSISYNTGEENNATNFNGGTQPYYGLYNGTSWVQATATQASQTFTSANTVASSTATSFSVAMGKDIAFLPAAPTVTSIDVTSGYSGSTIVITGTSLTGATAVSFGGTAAASYTVNSATQITAVVGTGGTSGSISVTTPSGTGSLAGFTYLGFITTTGASNWNTPASWLGGVVPTANNAVTIANNLSIAAAITNSPALSITVNTGITATASSTVAIGTVTNAITTFGTGVFTFTGASGSIIAGSFVNGGTLSWGAAATLNISASGTLTNNGTFTRGTGTVVFANAGTVNGSGAVTFKNLTLTAGALSLATTPTIDGTFALNGGNISTNAPIYTSSSTLQYGLTYSRFLEWSATGVGTIGTTAGYPNNVTIGGGTFTVVNSDAGTARALAGNVQVNTGCTFTTGALNAVLTIGGNLTSSGTGNFNMSTTNAAVTVLGSVSNAGTLALSSTAGGDLNVAGNWTNSGTFTPNSRAVTFNGAAAQAINSATTFAFLNITNSTADVTAAAAITVSSNLTINGSATATRLNMATNTLTLTGATMTVTSGFLRSAGTITNGTNTFGANGTYEHNFTTTAGTIPTATWNATSTCSIIGYTTNTTAPSGLNQAFGNFTWNCPGQTTGSINLLGDLKTINGNFSVISTGPAPVRELRLVSSNGSPYTATFGGIDISGGILSLMGSGTGGTNTSSVTVSGNVTLSGSGVLDMNSASNGTSTTLNIAGDLKTSGTSIIRRSNSATSTVNFNKSSNSQTFTQTAGTISNNINWNVGDGTTTNTLQLASNVNLGTGTGTFTVLGNATFDAGTFVLSGSAASTFNSGANIITANTGGVNGSVTLSGTRTYNADANYTFNNSTPSAQVTGEAVNAANNITINNSAGVSLSADVTLTGTVTLNSGSGNLKLGTFSLTVATPASISGAGSARFIETNGTGSLVIPVPVISSGSQAVDFPVGNGTNYTPVSYTFTSNTIATNLSVRSTSGIHPQNTAADRLARYWSTDISDATGEYAYSAQYTYISGDVSGTIGNIRLNRWNGSSWAGIAGSSASGTTLSSGNVTDGDGNLAGAQWTGRTIIAPAQYTWNNNSGGAWTTTTNWTPNGTPGGGDEVTFNGLSTFTVTAVPPGITLNKLTISGTAKVTWQPASAGTVNVGNGSAPQFTMASGTSLTLDGTASAIALNLNVLSGSSAQIDGTIILRRGAQRFTANTASSVQFRSGSRFVAGQTSESPTYSGNPFGTTGTAGVMVFQNGSVYESFAGANPFGLTQPASRVVFQTGSLYKHSSSLAISSLGRTYANFEYNQNSLSASLSASTAAMVMDNLTVSQGTLNFDLSGTPGHAIKGNISVASGATLSIAPASSGTINLSGTGTQTISGAGSFTTGANSILNISNSTAGGISVEKDITIGGSIIVASGGNFNVKAENIVSGGGGVTVGSGSTLGIGSAVGVNSSGATGNIQTSTRTFSSSANYTYIGTGNQATGNALPTTITGALTIANTGSSNQTVTLTTTNTTVSSLNLNSGLFACGTSQNLNVAAGGSINGNGGAQPNLLSAGTITFLGSGFTNGNSTGGNPNLYSVILNGGVDFNGNPNTNSARILNQLQLNNGGFCSNDAPFYESGSTLVYNNGGSFDRNLEWGQVTPLAQGYPHHVVVRNGTIVNLGTNTPQSLAIAGDLNIGFGAETGVVNLNNGVAIPLNINGNLSIGTINSTSNSNQLNLSTSVGGDLWLQGNFTRWGAGIFADNKRETFFRGTGNSSVTAAAQDFAFLRINKSSGNLTLNCPVGITAPISGLDPQYRLSLESGLINTTSTNLLTIGPVGVVVGGGSTSFVNGPMARITGATGSYSFPVGKGSAYKPMTFTATGVGGNTFTGEYFNNSYSFLATTSEVYSPLVLGVMNNEYWQLDRTGSTTNGTVTLPYTNPGATAWRKENAGTLDLTGCANCNVAVVKRNAAGPTHWSFENASEGFFNTGTPETRWWQDAGNVVSKVISTFSPFTFGVSYNNVLVLPITLLGFEGKTINGNHQLMWSIADDKSLTGFDLQHSTDGVLFSTLFTHNPSGLNYNYSHINPDNGIHYYRLLLKDKNGKTTYSKVVILINGKVQTFITGLVQNPVGQTAKVQLYSAGAQKIRATLTDVSGRLLARFNQQIITGQQNIDLSLGLILPGNYFLTLQTEDGVSKTLQLAKQ